MVLGLFTGLLAPGGIQRIGLHVGAVLSSYAIERGEPLRLFSLNDPVGNHVIEVNGVQLSIEGFNRKKTQFFFAVAGIALNVRIVYVGHVNLAPLLILFRFSNCRSIIATHGVEVWQPMFWWRTLALRLASKVTAPSTYTAQALLDIQRIQTESVVVIPWALDPGFNLIADEGTSLSPEFPSRRILLTVSRLASSDGYKGVDTVIQAFKFVREKIPEVYYVILGDGDQRARLERIATEIGVGDHVFFAGFVPDEELQAYYRQCEIFVMPSKGEGFGLVFIEAMSCGKPVIGARHGGTLDVIVEGETGFLVEYGDVAGLAQCLLHLLKNESLRIQLGEAGKKRVEEVYSFCRFKKELTTLFNED